MNKFLFNVVDILKKYNFELTHADIFPVWYIDKGPKRPISYCKNGGSFYSTDPEDCDVNVFERAPYSIHLESK